MEKVNEIERYILTTIKSAKKKDIDGAGKIGCDKSILVKNWRKKKFSGRYEIDSLIA